MINKIKSGPTIQEAQGLLIFYPEGKKLSEERHCEDFSLARRPADIL